MFPDKTPEDLPAEFTPPPQEPVKEKPPEKRAYVAYSVTAEGAGGNRRTVAGPLLKLIDALRTSRFEGCPHPVIVRHNINGSDEAIYTWEKDKWVKIPGVK